MQYIVEGGHKLQGEITISGNKNSVFPCMAATLLTDEEVILENIPDINDTAVLIRILETIGVKVVKNGSTVTLRSSKLNPVLPHELVTKLRGSIVLAGAVLSRCGEVTFHHPGGDVIGRRGIEVHLEGFENLGAKVEQNDLFYRISFPNKLKLPTQCHIFQPITSVTGTENLILASVLHTGTVILRNVASDPHVVDLCKMLLLMGADISGVGSTTLTIHGVDKLRGIKYRISSDHLELGAYAIAAAVTSGKITVGNIDNLDLDPVLVPLSKFGLGFSKKNDKITFSADKLVCVPKLITGLWPGFPTDMMSPAIVLATQAEGVTLCHDWIYESRMFFVDKLIAMGANITIADPHRVLVYGPTKLHGRELETPDIRAGMALVLAALIARGSSVINRAELIDRGYEDVLGKLKKLGAKITKNG